MFALDDATALICCIITILLTLLTSAFPLSIANCKVNLFCFIWLISQWDPQTKKVE